MIKNEIKVTTSNYIVLPRMCMCMNGPKERDIPVYLVPWLGTMVCNVMIMLTSLMLWENTNTRVLKAQQRWKIGQSIDIRIT